MNSSKITLTLALTAAIGAAGIAHAAGNPFALNALSQGYMVAAADKAQDGKCGASKNAKVQDGQCGGAKDAKAKDTKAKDGKCGEGKCGATKKDAMAKDGNK
ncbi:hypothetical protein [Thiobacillus denitrificans]|uniref:Low-complexity protein n=1 Tax=Thiobacillus denitrificans TaxID=36861 RepID=A0A106BKK9_THIDE|nr:hypothetical protein [Thiobacillus denitrificans]KVW94191.1 hypothetical protein ABW22_12345 [Thiobacillus denitrificans]